MNNTAREQLLMLCGGTSITPHQLEQIGSHELRAAAISDLDKIVSLYLNRPDWKDENFEVELCFLALRGPELLAAIEKEIFDTVKTYINNPSIKLEQVLESLLTIRRRPTQDEEDKYSQEDCALTIAIQCIYWSMATGLRPWPELKEFQEFERSVQERLGLTSEKQPLGKSAQGLQEEVISIEARAFIGEVVAQQFPNASFIFANKSKLPRAKLPQKLTEEELLKKEKKARDNLSKWNQASALFDVTKGWMASGNIDKAIESALSIRRKDKKSDALAYLLEAKHHATGDWDSMLLVELEESINRIPFQTKRVRFGGTGRERAKYLTQLAILRRKTGDSGGSADCMFRALSELTTPIESIHDQVDFALAAAEFTSKPDICLQYAVKKIGEVWNWGDQGRMFKWVYESCCRLKNADLVEAGCEQLEADLVQLESLTSNSIESILQSLRTEPRTCLYMNLYRARVLIHHKKKKQALKLLDRIESLGNWVQEKQRGGEYLQFVSDAYTEAGEFNKAREIAAKITNPLYRCRSLLFLMENISRKSIPQGLDVVRGLEEEGLGEQASLLKRKEHDVEVRAKRLIFSDPMISGGKLLTALDDSTTQIVNTISAIWNLSISEAPQIRDWISNERNKLSQKCAELEIARDQLKPRELRRLCEIRLALDDWDSSCRLIGWMPKDCLEIIQLMNRPLMLNILFREYPDYGSLSGWINSMGLGELTHRWIMRQWRRHIALTSPGARDLLQESFADSDWWANQWAVRCYLLASLREGSQQACDQLIDALSSKLELPELKK